MFFSHDQLGKRSALGTVWMAAHMERRLKRKQIDGTDIGVSVGERAPPVSGGGAAGDGFGGRGVPISGACVH
jgi:hypothetical protein